MATISVLNTTSNLSGKTLAVVENAQTITGLWTFDRDPSPPFAVSSGSAVVANLDADMVDGIEGASFLRSDEADTGSGALTLSATSPLVLSHATGAIVHASAGDLSLTSIGSIVFQIDTDSNGTEDFLWKDGASTDLMRLGEGGQLFVNESANGEMTIGLTINQGANDNEIVALKSSDVGHGMTDDAEADTYGTASKGSGADGGLQLTGFSEGTIGLLARGKATTETNTRSTSGGAAVALDGYKYDGATGSAAMTADRNVLCVRSGTTARFFLDSDGDSHQDVGTAWTNFDAYDDLQLLDAVAASVSPDPIREGFGRWLNVSRGRLLDLPGKPIVQFNDDGHHFVNMSRLTMLLVGAVRQLGRTQQAHRRLLDAEGTP